MALWFDVIPNKSVFCSFAMVLTNVLRGSVYGLYCVTGEKKEYRKMQSNMLEQRA